MKKNIPADHWIRSRPIAHRGLHNITKLIPENSLAAFEQACIKNFPIELDVRSSKDGKAVVFHDVNMHRLTGVSRDVSDVTSPEFRNINLLNTQEHVPLLKEALEFINGRVPVLIEIKRHFLPGQLENDVLSILSEYKGEFALVSFNPIALRYLHYQAPQFLIGINIGNAEKYFFQNLQINQVVNKLSSPDFISYSMNGNSPILSSSYFKKYNSPILAWTIPSKDAEVYARKFADNIIFENYLPV